MPLFQSIKQHLQNWNFSTTTKGAPVLPDVRNAGIVIKILIVLAGLSTACALFSARNSLEWATLILQYYFYALPVAIVVIIGLMCMRQFAPKASVKTTEIVAYTIAIATANLFYFAIFHYGQVPYDFHTKLFAVLKVTLVTAIGLNIIFQYLFFIGLSLAPASAQIRLQSLTYRIRPHFLFNSLNAILALIRRDTRKAEYALEELAELFRWLLKDIAQFVTIRKEIDIVQQFLAIEKVRLGDRLHIVWDIHPTAQNAIIPALTLQPLIENAIYHGVESMVGECAILVKITYDTGIVGISVSNPFDPNFRHKKGSGIALETIKQRLELCFDLEFRVHTRLDANRYTIELTFPFRTEITNETVG